VINQTIFSSRLNGYVLKLQNLFDKAVYGFKWCAFSWSRLYELVLCINHVK